MPKRTWNVSWMYEIEVEAGSKQEAEFQARKDLYSNNDHCEEFRMMISNKCLQIVEKGKNAMTNDCDLCGRTIPEQEAPALCGICKLTARAHARVDRNYAEYQRACSSDEQLDTNRVRRL